MANSNALIAGVVILALLSLVVIGLLLDPLDLFPSTTDVAPVINQGAAQLQNVATQQQQQQSGDLAGKVAMFKEQVVAKAMANKVATGFITAAVVLAIVAVIAVAVWFGLRMKAQEEEQLNAIHDVEPATVQKPVQEPTLWEQYKGLWIALIVVGGVLVVGGLIVGIALRRIIRGDFMSFPA